MIMIITIFHYQPTAAWFIQSNAVYKNLHHYYRSLNLPLMLLQKRRFFSLVMDRSWRGQMHYM